LVGSDKKTNSFTLAKIIQAQKQCFYHERGHIPWKRLKKRLRGWTINSGVFLYGLLYETVASHREEHVIKLEIYAAWYCQRRIASGDQRKKNLCG
jgi:hypothetical protein